MELAKKISLKKKIRDAFSSLRGRVHIAFLINFDKFSFLFSLDMGIKGARHRFFAASLLRIIGIASRHRFSTSLPDIASRLASRLAGRLPFSTPLLDSLLDAASRFPGRFADQFPGRFASRRRFSIPWSIRSPTSLPNIASRLAHRLRCSTSLLLPDSLVDFASSRSSLS